MTRDEDLTPARAHLRDELPRKTYKMFRECLLAARGTKGDAILMMEEVVAAMIFDMSAGPAEDALNLEVLTDAVRIRLDALRQQHGYPAGGKIGRTN